MVEKNDVSLETQDSVDVKRNEPQLRFKEFTGELSKKSLYEIAKINPKTPKLPNEFIYIDLESVVNGLLKKINKIKKNDAPSRAQRVLSKGDILFQTVRPYQKNNLFFNLDDDYYVASTGYAQIKSKINAKYLYQYFLTQNFVNEVLKRCTGTSYPAINSEDLKEIKLFIPTLEEQEKIASFLSFIDNKIELLEKTLVLYQKIKKYFVENIFKQNLRFYGFQDEWKTNNLNSLSIVKDGTHDSPKYVLNGYPLITSKNLINGKLDISDVNLISEEDFININKRSKVDVGDILFGMIGTIGNPVICDKSDFAIKNVALIKEKHNLKNKFLIYLLDSDFIKKQFYKCNAGGTQKFIALNLIRNLNILYPSLDEQEKIIGFFNLLDKKIDLKIKSINNLKNYKKSLLQKMFV